MASVLEVGADLGACEAAWPKGVEFLIGIGGKRSGPIWLCQELWRHPRCRRGPSTGVHDFDTLVRMNGHIPALRRSAKEMEPRRRKSTLPNRCKESVQDPSPDHREYGEVLTAGRHAGDVAREITLAYGVRPDEMFAEMASLEGVRFLFIMRERDARAWSAPQGRAEKKFEEREGFEAAWRRARSKILHGKKRGGMLFCTEFIRTRSLLDRFELSERSFYLLSRRCDKRRQTGFAIFALVRECKFRNLERSKRAVRQRLVRNRRAALLSIFGRKTSVSVRNSVAKCPRPNTGAFAINKYVG